MLPKRANVSLRGIARSFQEHPENDKEEMAMKTKAFVFLFFLIAAGVMALTSSVGWTQTGVGEVVVGNLSAMTGPTSTTHAMAMAGGKEYFYYVNKKFGGIKGKMGTVKVINSLTIV